MQGPKTAECIELSGLLSIAVDFAKHGECVSPDHFEHLQKVLDKKWPDFFEKPNAPLRISDGVLGKLYRDINNEKPLNDFIQN